MSNRCINTDGKSITGRARTAGSDYVSSEDVKDESRLAEILRELKKRVTILEASRPQDWIEFIVDFDNNTKTLNHGFKGGTRWFPTFLEDIVDPIELEDIREGSISLSCASTGRAVIRIESSQFSN